MRAGKDRIVLRVAPDHTALEPVIIRWIETGIENLHEFRRSRHAHVYRVVDNANETPLFVKEFFARDRWDYVKQRIHGSRGKRTILNNATINQLGFHTKTIIALAEYRRHGLIRKSVIITREIPGTHEAREIFRDAKHGLRHNPIKRRQMIHNLGAELGAWHKAGLQHGDLRLSNLLIQMENDTANFHWMDNERTRRYRTLSRERRIHNLMQVIMDPGVFSRSDIMRLWRAYKDASGFQERDEKAFVREVIRRTRKRWRERNWL